ncbi:MAG: hypothetical protein ACYTG0_33485 [Planctomycetota bacterium]
MKKLEPSPIPETIHNVGDTFEIVGKRTRLSVGVLKAGQASPIYGLNYVYNDRIILACSDLGAQQRRGITNLCGFVELLDAKWKNALSPTKDDITLAAERQALEQAVFSRVAPLLDLAQEERQAEMARLIEQRLNTAVADADLKFRSYGRIPNGIPTAPVQPQEDGKQEATPTKKEDKEEEPPKHRKFAGITVDFKDFGPGQLEPWQVNGYFVVLNLRNRYIYNIYRHSAKDQTPIAGVVFIAFLDAHRTNIQNLGAEAGELMRVLGETLNRIVPTPGDKKAGEGADPHQ